MKAFRCSLAAALVLAGCSKDPPKPTKDEPPKSTPVPSDMVFNDFLPSGGGGGGLAVRMDGGLEAGLSGAGGGGGGGAGAGGAEPAAGDRVKLLEPGAEPRTARRYAFAVGKPQKRALTVRTSISAQGKVQDAPALTTTFEITAKDVKPKATKFEIKVLKAELADAEKLPPQLVAQAAKELDAFKGLAASFEVTPRGDVGELSLAGSDKMKGQGAEEVIQILTQLIDVMLVPLPEAPVGIGAKWELEEGGEGNPAKGKRVLELKELNDGVANIGVVLERKVPKRAVPDPRMRGATVEATAKGTFTYTARFDQVATKVVGDMSQTEKIEVPVSETEKKSVVRETKVKHLLEAPAK